MILSVGSQLGHWAATKTNREEGVVLCNQFFKDIKGVEETLTKTPTSFVTLGTAFLLSGPQFISLINEEIGLLIY